ncbi:MarR family transcriptional regulator [Hyphobacterium sp. HN65]|uniref:MarR family transcriptional regulator n=1 Tax=Hyphobacterium lacteum TaxID=3116575 RepID=A0ABU7LM12_9PROT|nr:MarR family transcriptional regulator [Hyphobacterium sp. HN65]MEE2524962.1 MarR family transcriptional regulator [Hyphobacterium sp. HN65]
MNIQDDILVALRRITRAIDLHSRKVLKASGLTSPQLVVLQALKKNGDLYPSSIARIASLSQATITSILDRLQAQGLITRQRCTEDRRQILVSLTVQAHERLRDAPELLQAGFLREFDKLESWEQLQLLASLQRLAELMDAEDIDAAPILEVGDIAKN